MPAVIDLPATGGADVGRERGRSVEFLTDVADGVGPPIDQVSKPLTACLLIVAEPVVGHDANLAAGEGEILQRLLEPPVLGHDDLSPPPTVLGGRFGVGIEVGRDPVKGEFQGPVSLPGFEQRAAAELGVIDQQVIADVGQWHERQGEQRSRRQKTEAGRPLDRLPTEQRFQSQSDRDGGRREEDIAVAHRVHAEDLRAGEDVQRDGPDKQAADQGQAVPGTIDDPPGNRQERPGDESPEPQIALGDEGGRQFASEAGGAGEEPPEPGQVVPPVQVVPEFPRSPVRR